jgi:hypothetical protein
MSVPCTPVSSEAVAQRRLSRSCTAPLHWQADTGIPLAMYGGYYMRPTWNGQSAATDGNGLSSEAQ